MLMYNGLIIEQLLDARKIQKKVILIGTHLFNQEFSSSSIFMKRNKEKEQCN